MNTNLSRTLAKQGCAPDEVEKYVFGAAVVLLVAVEVAILLPPLGIGNNAVPQKIVRNGLLLTGQCPQKVPLQHRLADVRSVVYRLDSSAMKRGPAANPCLELQLMLSGLHLWCWPQSWQQRSN